MSESTSREPYRPGTVDVRHRILTILDALLLGDTQQFGHRVQTLSNDQDPLLAALALIENLLLELVERCDAPVHRSQLQDIRAIRKECEGSHEPVVYPSGSRPDGLYTTPDPGR